MMDDQGNIKYIIVVIIQQVNFGIQATDDYGYYIFLFLNWHLQ